MRMTMRLMLAFLTVGVSSSISDVVRKVSNTQSRNFGNLHGPSILKIGFQRNDFRFGTTVSHYALFLAQPGERNECLLSEYA